MGKLFRVDEVDRSKTLKFIIWDISILGLNMTFRLKIAMAGE